MSLNKWFKNINENERFQSKIIQKGGIEGMKIVNIWIDFLKNKQTDGG